MEFVAFNGHFKDKYYRAFVRAKNLISGYQKPEHLFEEGIAGKDSVYEIREQEWACFRGCGKDFRNQLREQGIIRAKDPIHAMSKLSNRTRNCLLNAGIEEHVTRKSLIKKIQNNEIKPHFCRNFGKTSYLELCDLLNLKNEIALNVQLSKGEIQEEIEKTERKLERLKRALNG